MVRLLLVVVPLAVLAGCKTENPAFCADVTNASDGKNYIETVWGRGYVLREPTEDEARIPA